MTKKRQQPVSFDLTFSELELIKRLYPTALQNVRRFTDGDGAAIDRDEANDVLAFDSVLQQHTVQTSTTLQIKPAVIYWIISVMNQFQQVGSTSINVAPFTKEDVRRLYLKLGEPFQGTNGSFYRDTNHQ